MLTGLLVYPTATGSCDDYGEVNAICDGTNECTVLTGGLPRHVHRKGWCSDERGEDYASADVAEAFFT
jgi:hypothetical protein